MNGLSKFEALFIESARRNIVNAKNALLGLKNNPVDKNASELLYRSIHSLHGEASVMQYTSFAQFLMLLESVAKSVMEGTIEFTSTIEDYLNIAVRKIEDGVETIESMQNELDYSHEISQLNNIIKSR